MSTQPTLLPLRTAATALAIAGVLFVAANALMYGLLYPPAGAPAEPSPPAAAVVPTVPSAPSAASVPADDTSFTSMTGDWVRADGVVTQRALDRVDFLSASGIQGERYVVSVTIGLPAPADVPEAGGGLVFHMPQRDRLAGSQLVRLHQNGQELLWGWYDADGTFQYEGGQPLPAAAGTNRVLALSVRGDRADVRVDDVPIVSDLVLQSASGYLGLLSYRGGVTFTDFRLAIGAG